MTVATALLRELETMPKEAAEQVLDFAMFIKSRHASAQPAETVNFTVPTIKDAYGIFKGIDTHFERDEDDRV
jgi:hypothetical protein